VRVNVPTKLQIITGNISSLPFPIDIKNRTITSMVEMKPKRLGTNVETLM